MIFSGQVWQTSLDWPQTWHTTSTAASYPILPLSVSGGSTLVSVPLSASHFCLTGQDSQVSSPKSQPMHTVSTASKKIIHLRPPLFFYHPFFRWLLHYIQNRKQISTTQSCFCGLVQKYIGGRNRIRTYDLLGQNQALYQLSYAAILMPEAGLEPAIYTEYDSQKWTVHLLLLPSTHLGYSGILKGQSPFFARLAVRTRLCGSRCRSSPVFCSGGA